MLELPGYRTIESIGGNEEIELYRLLRLEDGQSVIAKTTREEYPGPAMQAAFRHEYEMLGQLDGRGAAKPYSLDTVADRPVLLLEDIGGSLLRELLDERGSVRGIPAYLGIAAAIADSLAHLHRAQITHFEITPCHLMVNPDTLEAKWIDIRQCAAAAVKSPLSDQADRPSSVLPYISPEQTGRSGRIPDYRSDFYSLGITLYEWLTGSLPFAPQDTWDIVYRHLASTPEPVHIRNIALPRMVSDIVSRCMAKMPDARYASAFGILADLEACRDRYRETGDVEPFILGDRDIPDRWLFPAQLYGRHVEQAGLLEALKRASAGSVEAVWVCGSGGIGKTSLVRETLRPVGGYSLTGKCDLGQTSVPYDIWVQALGELVDQLLMESKVLAEVWKLRILDAVGGYGQLLIDFIPRLEILIGPQPPVPPVPSMEAQQRFHLLLNRFLGLFMEQEHPLVLFFDDLQWADEASLHYLAGLMTDWNSRYLLVVGTYRDEEMPPEHSFFRLETQLQLQNVSTRRVPLRALDSSALCQLLKDAMRTDAAETETLAAALLHKTEGNPFFLKQFLQDLLDRRLVSFEDERRCWQWDLRLITEMDIPDNIAAYLLERMNHLPESAIYALSRGACLGNRFDLASLRSITDLSEAELREAIRMAVQERLLQQANGQEDAYSFQHDRIRQAAYGLISGNERPDLHLRIGLLLAQRMLEGQETNVFEAANQWNQALDRIHSPELRLQMVELNLRAGLQAKKATAYETALGYFRHAMAFLDDTGWDTHYELAFRVYKERAESEFLCTRFETAHELFRQLQRRTRTPLEQALVLGMMIQLESSQDNYEHMIALGEKALPLLGIAHNFKPGSLELTRKWVRLLWKLRKRPIQSLGDLPPMTDEGRLVAMNVLLHVSNACFAVEKKGWAAVLFLMLEMTMEHGIAPESSNAFAGYAIFLHFRFNQYAAAHEWGALAVRLSEPYPALHVKVISAYSLCYDSWRKHDPGFLIKTSKHTGKVGLESGDLWSGNQSVLINCSLMFQFGHPLGEIYNQLMAHASNFQRGRNNLQWAEASVFAELLSHLTGYSAPDDPFEKSEVDLHAFADSVHGDYYNLVQEFVCITHYLEGYLFGSYREAYEYVRQAIAILEARQEDLMEHSSHYTYESLLLAELYAEAGEKEQRRYLARMRKRLRKLKTYADRSPENYLHKYWLIQAELAKLTGKERRAEELYELTIEDARKHGHVHNVGIAAERYSKYGLQRGKLQLAKLYMAEAYAAYQQWGAAAKAADLAAKYGHMLPPQREPGWDRLDVLSVMKSAQALSVEMEMPRLLHTLMGIMLQNAGAAYGALLFEQAGNWAVEVHGTAESLAIKSVPLEEAAAFLPVAIIGYAARTKEEVILHDAAGEGMFARNPYVRDQSLKSVLCLPILHQDKLICLLYMENKLSSGLFTPERLDILKLLCSQCAISIDNARLYSGIQQLRMGLERQVAERTRSLERSMRETAAALTEMSVYEERNRIAQEIHDVVGHTLTSTILQVEAGKRLLHKDKEGAVTRLEEAQDLVRHGLSEIRRSVHMLKEGQSFDLGQALKRLIRDAERNTGIAVVAAIGELPELSGAQKKVIYHALQEGLTNGIRHGESTEFRFQLEYKGASLLFRLEDNGKCPDVMIKGFGLKSMQERVEQLGGRLHIGSHASPGCVLQLDIPCLTHSGGTAI